MNRLIWVTRMNTSFYVVFPIWLIGSGFSAQQDPDGFFSTISTFQRRYGDGPNDLPWSTDFSLLASDAGNDAVGSSFGPSFAEPETSFFVALFLAHRERLTDTRIERVVTVLPIELAPKQGPPATHTNG